MLNLALATTCLGLSALIMKIAFVSNNIFIAMIALIPAGVGIMFALIFLLDLRHQLHHNRVYRARLNLLNKGIK